MTTATYFKNPKTLEELKKEYRELCFKHHPDRGGNTEIMKAVNNEYESLFQLLKNTHKNKDGEMYTARTETAETPEQFIELINELMQMDDIVIEIIGCFVWVTGNTRAHKDKLKELKFRWHNQKSAWYLKPEDYKRRSKRKTELDEIREMYGTKSYNSTGQAKLQAN